MIQPDCQEGNPLDRYADLTEMAHRFPRPPAVVAQAYRNLSIAANGTDEQKRALGNRNYLPRPWDPGSCQDPKLRSALWVWLEEVVAWFNRAYTWDGADLIPTCWPRHPHLVHELAVLADQRRRAGLELTSHDLEEWHRYSVPHFVDRMRGRMRGDLCVEGHRKWPGHGRQVAYLSAVDRQTRGHTFTADLDLHGGLPPSTPQQPDRPGLAAVNTGTGEVPDDYDPTHDDPSTHSGEGTNPWT